MQTGGPSLTGLRLVLGITGSIAAYKAVGLLRLLRLESAEVRVVMTAGACRFVAPLTFEVLSGAHVATDLFEAHQEMLHLSLPEKADAILIAPATANCLARAALGLADDLLSTYAPDNSVSVFSHRRWTEICGDTPPSWNMLPPFDVAEPSSWNRMRGLWLPAEWGGDGWPTSK